MLGGSEIILILAVAFLLFGPQKMPEIGRSVGKALRELHKVRDEFLRGVDGVGDDLKMDTLLDLDEEPPRRRPKA